jgi:hypothetical protein
VLDALRVDRNQPPLHVAQPASAPSSINCSCFEVSSVSVASVGMCTSGRAA